MTRPQHDFAKWLVEKHSKSDTPVGDLARDVRDGLGLPDSGDRAALRYHLDYNGVDQWALDALDVAWAEYEQASADEHPFVLWLVEKHCDADTPLGHFARVLSPDFPVSGERVDLRRFLEYNGADEYMLACFDVAWEQFSPTCSYVRCTEPAANKSLLCELHGLL